MTLNYFSSIRTKYPHEDKILCIKSSIMHRTSTEKVIKMQFIIILILSLSKWKTKQKCDEIKLFFSFQRLSSWTNQNSSSKDPSIQIDEDEIIQYVTYGFIRDGLYFKRALELFRLITVLPKL